MWSGASAAKSYVTDDVPALNVLSGGNGKTGEMAIPSPDAVTVVHHNCLAVSTQELSEHDSTICGSNNRLPIRGRDINPTVKSTFSVERIDAFAEGSRNRPFHRPQIGSRVGARPVGSRHVAGQSER